MSDKATVKILVGYHKPSILVKNDTFVPIHLGRAVESLSKDGKVLASDKQWLIENTIGDDTGENISDLNRYLCEYTGLYWAWKNYDKLGDPDYFGFVHYRRFLLLNDHKDKTIDYSGQHRVTFLTEKLMSAIGLDEDVLRNSIDGVDAVLTKRYKHRDNVREQFTELCGPEFCLNHDLWEKVVSEVYKSIPNYKSEVDEYLNSFKHYWYNCFILKKELFFEYMEFSSKILLKVFNETDFNNTSIAGQRTLAYISERLFGIFITYKKLKNIIEKPIVFIENTDLPVEIKPAFSSNLVPIVLAANAKYIFPLTVCIQSIISNSSSINNYDICVLNDDLSPENKKMLKSMMPANFSIRFVPIKYIVSQYPKKLFKLSFHYSIETYYRIFLSLVFKNYEKMIYIDCDTVVMKDLAELMKEDVEGFLLAATHDIAVVRSVYHNTLGMKKYLKEELQMTDVHHYFQAGLMLINMKKFIEEKITEKSLSLLSKVNPKYSDQCILNSICNGKVKFLPSQWNYLVQIPMYDKLFVSRTPAPYNKMLEDAENNLWMIHYSAGVKPWNSFTSNIPFESYFWKYARLTSIYEKILFNANERTVYLEKKNSKGIKFKYFKYRLLSKITFGSTREKYKRKKALVKNKLKNLREFRI